jgi:hypothetical protein
MINRFQQSEYDDPHTVELTVLLIFSPCTVRSHSKVPFVTDFDHASKPVESTGFDVQYKGYIIWHPKSIFLAAHTAARAKYEAHSNMPS